MTGREKKVIVFIVEGASDEAALGSILKEYFRAKEISFFVARGDITTKNGITTGNIVKEINGFVKQLKGKYRYKDSDILEIIHLIDTDGAFVDGSLVRKRKSKGPVLYYTDHIEANHVGNIIERNRGKAEILKKLSKTSKIGRIRYSIYYMSCNLEHVLYGELREFSIEEKWRLSDEFAEEYEGRADEFAEFLEDEAAVRGNYKETWEFIEQGAESLRRNTNFHLLFKE